MTPDELLRDDVSGAIALNMAMKRQYDAGYKQALEDVVDLFDRHTDLADDPESEEFRAALHACLTVIHFAREHGIELNEGE